MRSIVCLAALVPCVLIGALSSSGCSKNAPAASQAQPPPPEVVVSTPVFQEVTDYFEFPGQTAAIGEVEVRARVTGYIVKINFEDGQEVKAGDLLFEIDPRPYQAALDRAKGDLARLKALQAKAQADLARAEQLRPSGAASQEDYDQAVAQLAVQEASISSAEAAVREAELNLEFTRVTSPIGGRVGRRLVTEGNLVTAGQNNSVILTTVVTTDPVYVYFNIEEPALLQYMNQDWRVGENVLLSRIKELNSPIEIGLADEEGFPHVGTLDFLDNEVDRETGTIQARGVFDNATQYLTPGLYVHVRIPIGKPSQAMLIRERAIRKNLDEKFVLVVNAENTVEERPIKVGSLKDGMRVVLAGLKPDDRVIVEGTQRARTGSPVTPRLAEAAAVAEASSGTGSKRGTARDQKNGKSDNLTRSREPSEPGEQRQPDDTAQSNDTAQTNDTAQMGKTVGRDERARLNIAANASDAPAAGSVTTTDATSDDATTDTANRDNAIPNGDAH